MLQRCNRTDGFSIVVLACTLGFALSAVSFSTPTQANENFHDLIQREFEKYDPDYQVRREHYGKRLEAMSAAIADAQAKGLNLHCSQQMFLEAKWLHRYTCRF